jgi:hypothetical protein
VRYIALVLKCYLFTLPIELQRTEKAPYFFHSYSILVKYILGTLFDVLMYVDRLAHQLCKIFMRCFIFLKKLIISTNLLFDNRLNCYYILRKIQSCLYLYIADIIVFFFLKGEANSLPIFH